MPNATITSLIGRISKMLPESTYLASKPDRQQLASLYEALRFPQAPTPPMQGLEKMAPTLKKEVGTCCGKVKEKNMKKYVRSAIVSIKNHGKVLEEINSKAVPYVNVNELTTLNAQQND